MIFQFSSGGFEQTDDDQTDRQTDDQQTPGHRAKHYIAMCAVAQGLSQGGAQGVSLGGAQGVSQGGAQGGEQGGASSGAGRTKASRERERKSHGTVAYNLKEAARQKNHRLNT